MAASKAPIATGETGDVDQLARIANLLALLLVRGESQTEKILTLSAAGFAPGEIAALLGTTANSVSVTVYQAKKQGKKSKARAK